MSRMKNSIVDACTSQPGEIVFNTMTHTSSEIVQDFDDLLFGCLHKLANLISKLNFQKLIPYPMDNCFTGRCDRSRQTSQKDVL